jgi:LPS-assembly protein
VRRARGITHRAKSLAFLFYKVLIITVLSCLSFFSYCLAEEQTIITSDTLEYSKKTSTYVATGNVKIQREDMVIEADEMEYNEQTGDVIAVGSVKYKDETVSFQASRVEFNINSKTGKFYDAEILFIRDNYHIAGREIEKKGDKYYVSPEARFTTCDGPEPEWCFKGKDIELSVGEELKAEDVSFRIMNIPILYAPYLKAPFLTERQTGFLIPSVGYSDKRGGMLRVPFYWAISEDSDATFIADVYTEIGIGQGIEYRYVKPENTKGLWWLYHIRDNKDKKNYFEMKASHEQRSSDGLGGYLNINYVNEKDFFRKFELDLETRTNRFLESTGEIALPFTNSRLYLLSQYWVDLKEESTPAPQKLPEAGFVIHPTALGDFWVSATSTFANFWRDEGVIGQRLDIYPQMHYMFGKDVVVTQKLGLRGTAYALYRSEDDSLYRGNLEYAFVTNTRLLKRYRSFTHVLEPSIGYHFISESDDDVPLFDSTELFKKTSQIELSLLNRFIDDKGEFLVMKLSQAYDTYLHEKPFLPLTLEVGLRRPLSLRLDASYDVHEGEIESVNSDLLFRVLRATFSLGQRYNKPDDILTFVGGIGFRPVKSLSIGGRIWCDAKEKEVQEVAVNMRYKRKCWGLHMEFIKSPGDLTVIVMFDLLGVSAGF